MKYRLFPFTKHASMAKSGVHTFLLNAVQNSGHKIMPSS